MADNSRADILLVEDNRGDIALITDPTFTPAVPEA